MRRRTHVVSAGSPTSNQNSAIISRRSPSNMAAAAASMLSSVSLVQEADVLTANCSNAGVGNRRRLKVLVRFYFTRTHTQTHAHIIDIGVKYILLFITCVKYSITDVVVVVRPLFIFNVMRYWGIRPNVTKNVLTSSLQHLLRKN